jgi:hypothetical protein
MSNPNTFLIVTPPWLDLVLDNLGIFQFHRVKIQKNTIFYNHLSTMVTIDRYHWFLISSIWSGTARISGGTSRRTGSRNAERSGKPAFCSHAGNPVGAAAILRVQNTA